MKMTAMIALLVLNIGTSNADDCAAVYFGDVPLLPLDVCMGYKSYAGGSYKYKCDDDDALNYVTYSGKSCSGTDTWTEFPTLNASCDASTCDYITFTMDADDCYDTDYGFGDVTMHIVTNCYDNGTQSMQLECLDEALGAKMYDSTDCTGTVLQETEDSDFDTDSLFDSDCFVCSGTAEMALSLAFSVVVAGFALGTM